MFRRLSLGIKLGASFLVLALASGVMGGFGLWVTGSLTAEVRDLTWNRLPAVQGAARMQEAVTRMRVLLRDGLEGVRQHDEASLNRSWRGWEEARAEALAGLAKFSESTLTPEEEELWRPVEPAFQQSLSLATAYWASLRDHDAVRAAALQGALDRQIDGEVVAPLRKLTALEIKIGDSLLVQSERLSARATRTLWATLGLIFAAAAAMAALLPRSVVRPVRSLSASALRIADGDLTPEVKVETQDEIGILAESFRRMVGRLRELVSTLQSASGELKAAAAHLAENTRAQNAVLERQASGVAETSATTRELEQTSSVAASRAAAVLEVAQRAAEMSVRGQASAERSEAELRHIQGTVQGLIGRSAALLEQARQVGDVVETVSDLAAQSHVLSLNASIEAVRAGEAGKSFAVVAQEVRSLAQQSGEGAQRIARTIQGIQAAVEESRTATEQGSQGMAGSIEEIRASGASLREIGAIVQETSQAATQIAAAVQQQSTGIGQIAAAMRDLDQGMEETVGQVRSLDQSARLVADTAAKIAEVAAQFRV